MIRLEKLSVKYGKKIAVDNVSLSAEDGRLTVILGKNGSGKSSLLRAVAGACRYEGGVYINGCELSELRGRDRAAAVSYMPQILPDCELTVRETILCGRVPAMGALALPGAEDRAAAERIMAETGLETMAGEKLSALSGGERQRVFFAMMAVQDAGALLLDEPTANLDTEYRRMVYDFIRKARERGKAVVLIMHHISEACRLADKICVMDRGRLLFEGCPGDFCASGLPESVFGMRPRDYMGPDGEKVTLFRPCSAEK